jgi:hypothetical protein
MITFKKIPIALRSANSIEIPTNMRSLKKGKYIIWSNELFENKFDLNSDKYSDLYSNLSQSDVDQSKLERGFLKTYGYYSVFPVDYINPPSGQTDLYGQLKLTKPTYINYNSSENLNQGVILNKIISGQTISPNILPAGTTLCLTKSGNNYILKRFGSGDELEDTYFILSYDGLWYNIKNKIYVIPTLYSDLSNLYKYSYKTTSSYNEAIKIKWNITNQKFGIGTKDSLSIWNTDNVFPFDGNGKLYDPTLNLDNSAVLDYENKWFSNPFGDFSKNPDTWKKSGDFGENGELYNCGRTVDLNSSTISRCDIRKGSYTCPSFMLTVDGWNAGDILEKPRAKCLYDQWDIQNRESCVVGNSFFTNERIKSMSWITDAYNQNFPKIPDRIDGQKCKLYRKTIVTGANRKQDVSVSGLSPTEVWGPWTQSSLDSQKVSRNLIEFCSQHDTIEDKSFTDSTRFKNTCGEIYKPFYGNRRIDDKSNLSVVQGINLNYVSNYPLANEAFKKCSVFTPNSTERLKCEGNVRDVCKGSFLETPVCQEFCINKTCENELFDYCPKIVKVSNFFNATLQDPTSILRRNLCGCHMNQEFYTNFFTKANSIANKIDSTIVIPEFPECHFRDCVLSSYKLKDERVCPARLICLSYVEITETGSTIRDTDIIINVDQKCSASEGGGGDGEAKDCLNNQNILTNKCINFCNTNPTKCETFLKDYCNTKFSSLPPNTLLDNQNISQVKLCYNYMPATFYSTLATDVKRFLTFSQTIPDVCFYKGSRERTNCPSESVCFNDEKLKITASGSVSGVVEKVDIPVCKNVQKGGGGGGGGGGGDDKKKPTTPTSAWVAIVSLAAVATALTVFMVSTDYKYKWIWFIIALLIIIDIGLLIYYLTRT